METTSQADVSVRSYAREQASHAHAFHQLVLPIRGGLDLEVGSRAGRVAGACGAVVTAGERHAFAGTADNRFAVLDLPDALVREVGGSRWVERAGMEGFFRASRQALELATLLAEDPVLDAAPDAVRLSWATLVLHAAASAGAERLPEPVERALLFIETRALGSLRVAQVARAAGVGARRLQALFRAHLGETPLERVRRRRVEAARRLLMDGEEPIAEVALRCGFADQASLSHAVRRLLGCTPGELRRRAPTKRGR